MSENENVRNEGNGEDISPEMLEELSNGTAWNLILASLVTAATIAEAQEALEVTS